MAVVSVRMDDKQKELYKKYAELQGQTMSDFINQIVFSYIEDEYDAALADKAYEEYQKDPKTYSHEEMMKKYGL
ncbi:type II toxin-antitoxin system RelB family antitoxin [Culicoidibacter larvae]|uniref:CopG family transcriptional regulator n=1 Tax=Culicoidibacter larvae TaxID=2579976 RepID=A0A5R8Q9I9_9FIRM|nr:DUF6290 family protein [Culicoidibacter larvae]TLG71268.1 hypothetical protein FEZ08_10995 [Culicoidibacter larvae]